MESVFNNYLEHPTADQEQQLYDYFSHASEHKIQNFIATQWPNTTTFFKIESPRLAVLLYKRFRLRNVKPFNLAERAIDVKGKATYIRAFQEAGIFKQGKYYVNLFYEGDLNELREQALSFLVQGNSVCNIYFNDDIPIEEVIKYGFIPLQVKDIVLEHLNVPKATLEFFYNEGTRRNFYFYCMFNEAEAKKTSPLDSTAAVFYTYPYLLYSSMRMRTDMSMYRLPGSNVGQYKGSLLQTDYGIYKSLPIQIGLYSGNYFIPVTRYSGTADTGLYYNEPYNKACGTFYYLEEESCTCILAKTVLIAQTKCSACIRLGLEGKTINKYLSSGLNRKWEEGKLNKDLMYTPSEYALLLNQVEIPEVPEVAIYCGKLLDLYAEEDVFDSKLCRLAQQNGIDIVILTRMVGAKQIVTEVYDVRSRVDSFKNLVYLQ